MRRIESERGAILVHTAFALLALLTFSGFAVDYGTFWVSRNQAQNAADAGALAGADARITNDSTNPPASKTTGIVPEIIATTVGWNAIWSQSSPMTVDWTCPDDGTTNCVDVSVYRDGTNGSSTLPTFFLSLAGINTQKTMGYAVAKIENANEFSGCLRPWFMIDKYTDANGDGTYDAGDTYSTPGYQIPADIGASVDFHTNNSPSGYGQVNVGQGKGGNQLQDAIEHCAAPGDGTPITIGSTLPTVPGGKQGPEGHGVADIVGWDPSATWDPTTKSIVGSCAATSSCTCDGNGCPNGASVSPRVVVAAVCAPTEANCIANGQNNGTITVVNILAFFITDTMQGNGNNTFIPAVLIGTGGGGFSSSGGSGSDSFVKLVSLIR